MSKEQLINGLNEDLSGELGTIIRYTYQSGKAVGVLGTEVRELLQSEIPDELRHASYLTDVIMNLGGEPTTTPKEFEKPEDLKGMLKVDYKMETDDVKSYTEHAKLAEELGEIELKVKLEEMAADESRHAREIDRILQGI